MTVTGYYESLTIKKNGDAVYISGGRHITYVYTGHIDFHDDGFARVSFNNMRIESFLYDALEESALREGREPANQRDFTLDYSTTMRWAVDQGGWLHFRANGPIFWAEDIPENMHDHYERINLALFKPHEY